MFDKKIRVMWLLNHTSARKFEVAMLKQIGISEIYLPKNFPLDLSFRSASIDYSEDENLTIPKDDLDIMNNADWYGNPSKKAWEIANKYFQVLFFILYKPEIIHSITRNFRGAIIWRAYGLVNNITHATLLQNLTKGFGEGELIKVGRRFWFGQAYSNLCLIENNFIRNRAIDLPLGLHNCKINDQWIGHNRKVFFICPDIGFNPYYKKCYENFVEAFKGIDYVIGGMQTIAVTNLSVLGYVPLEQHEENMRQFRVMFYHSTEPNHIHFHPFEAVRAGMPLAFMAGGMLDRLGGRHLPGRCKSISEATDKISRILNDDHALINSIRKSQTCLLDPMRPEVCAPVWQASFQRILDELEDTNLPRPIAERQPRIAVLVPAGYRGGSLRGTKLLARALHEGSRQLGEPVDIVLAHLDDPMLYPEEEFDDLPPQIGRRPYRWRLLDHASARRAMRYVGHDWEPTTDQYMVPDDGINQFTDCDLWVIISDRLNLPLLPIRPYVLMVYDYLQRYQAFFSPGSDQPFIDAARLAEKVMVTTYFTQQDALQYAGLPATKVCRVPMLAPEFESSMPFTQNAGSPPYFLWTTNAAPHKNHLNAYKALREYYEVFDGKLECHLTGVNTKNMLKSELPHLKPLPELVAASPKLRARVRLLGELPDARYLAELAGAMFLWHPARVDNGTFSVIEAAQLGVPALSSDYPAMREIDEQFSLNLNWMDADRPKQMARQLKWMEENYSSACLTLPTKKDLEKQNVSQLAAAYWRVLRECL